MQQQSTINLLITKFSGIAQFGIYTYIASQGLNSFMVLNDQIEIGKMERNEQFEIARHERNMELLNQQKELAEIEGRSSHYTSSTGIFSDWGTLTGFAYNIFKIMSTCATIYGVGKSLGFFPEQGVWSAIHAVEAYGTQIETLNHLFQNLSRHLSETDRRNEDNFRVAMDTVKELSIMVSLVLGIEQSLSQPLEYTDQDPFFNVD